jgi:copper transport protein
VVTLGRNIQRWWKVSAVVTSLVSATTFAVSGHASAASLPAIFAIVVGVHLLAVSVWVGSFFAAVTVRTEEGVARLSRLATVAMPIAVVTGVIEAAHLTGGISQVLDSRYGTYLLLKLAVIAVCLVIGYGLRRRMKAGRPTVTQSLFVEAVLLAVVIAITSVMVRRRQLLLPHHHRLAQLKFKVKWWQISQSCQRVLVLPRFMCISRHRVVH